MCKISVENREGKVPLRKPRDRCEDNIIMYLKNGVCLCGLDSSGSGTVQWSVVNLRVI